MFRKISIKDLKSEGGGWYAIKDATGKIVAFTSGHAAAKAVSDGKQSIHSADLTGGILGITVEVSEGRMS